MTATLAAAPAVAAPRMALVVGTKEVTFTPYVIRKVGEVRDVTIDGEVQKVIYNDRRGLTYLVLAGVGGRIAAELVADGDYSSCKRSARVAPVKAVAPVASVGVSGYTPEVNVLAKKARKAPKAAV